MLQSLAVGQRRGGLRSLYGSFFLFAGAITFSIGHYLCDLSYWPAELLTAFNLRPDCPQWDGGGGRRVEGSYPWRRGMVNITVLCCAGLMTNNNI